MKHHPLGNGAGKLSNAGFRVMSWGLRLRDLLVSSDARAGELGITSGDTVVDYGCGIGSFLESACRLVGDEGRVYAVDIHERAVEHAETLKRTHGLANLLPTLAREDSSSVPDASADLIYSLDMFHMVEDPTRFLLELRRIIKPDGVLVIEPGHQSMSTARERLERSGCWAILEQRRRDFRCTPAG